MNLLYMFDYFNESVSLTLSTRSAVDVGMIRLNMERAQAKLIRLAFIDYNHKVNMNTFFSMHKCSIEINRIDIAVVEIRLELFGGFFVRLLKVPNLGFKQLVSHSRVENVY